jgi:predicted DNA-binding protein with PD1-like motif
MIQCAGPSGKAHVLRLMPGDDVRPALERWCQERAIEAAGIVSAVGSLRSAHLRYAGRADGIITDGDLEVCALSGTLSRHGMHLHGIIADRDGRTIGGHLLGGCIVRTTLELIVLEVDNVRMLRSKDPDTTYDELDPRPLGER